MTTITKQSVSARIESLQYMRSLNPPPTAAELPLSRDAVTRNNARLELLGNYLLTPAEYAMALRCKLIK
jgi:hypothetical protein